MALAQLGDVPFMFTLKPGWANSLGTYTKSSCAQAIAELPRSKEIVDIRFRRPKIIKVGTCAIGVYVTKPDPSGTTLVTEIWDRVVGWTIDANNLNTAASSSGWVISTESGLQICFWEPEVVDRYHMCEQASTYTMKRPIPMTIGTCLDIIYTSRIQTSSIGTTTTTFSSAIPSTATGSLTSNAPGPTSTAQDTIIGECRSVATWSRPGFVADACYEVIRALHKAPISNVGSHMFMKYPQVYGNNVCTCGFFYTHPPASGQGMEIATGGVNFQQEALRLLMGTVVLHGQGGFVDLPNGIQIVLYDPALDPKHICWLTSRVNMRACLNNMVKYYKPGVTTARSSSRTEISVTPTSSIRD